MNNERAEKKNQKNNSIYNKLKKYLDINLAKELKCLYDKN
jgi:hypothetical protein